LGNINVAIIGVGNCASSLVQGIHFYNKAKENAFVPGLMHVNLGGYHISDINFVAAFDIDKNKVGKDLAEGIFTSPNNTFKFTDVPPVGVKIQRGMTHDGLGKYLSQKIEKAPGSTSDIIRILKETQTDVVLNYLPVGSEEATKWYVEQVLAAGCGFVNCIPVFIAREKYWQKRFEEKGLPVIGDDIKSQVGATIVHRVLTRLFLDRGVKLERTYQLNFGGKVVIPTSSICWSGSALSLRRYPRPTQLHRSWIISLARMISMLGPAIMCLGFWTASSVISEWKGGHLVMFP